MGTPATVGIDNDLATSQTSITLGTTNDEAARGLDLPTNKRKGQQEMARTYVVDGLLIKEVSGDDLLDDLFANLRAEIFSRDFLSMLSRNDNGIDAEGDGGTAVLLVLNGDLSLGVGTEPGEGTRATSGSHGSIELVGKDNGQGHVLLSLVGGVAEHDTLITSTMILEGTMVQALSNIGGLLLDRNQDVASLVVETLGRVVVANLLDGVADDLLVVKLGLGRDLAKDHDHAGLGSCLAGNLGVGVLCQAGVELRSPEILDCREDLGHVRWHRRPGHRFYLITAVSKIF